MRAEKKQLVDDIRALLEPSPSLFLISYKGLTAKGFAELRKSLDELESQCHVMPNRVFLRAVAECGIDALAGLSLTKDTALVTAGCDPVGIAKKLRDFAKAEKVVSFKLAVIEGKLCSASEASALADLPPREVLQAQLLGLLQAPATQVVRVLNAKVASIVYVLNAYLGEKEKAA